MKIRNFIASKLNKKQIQPFKDIALFVFATMIFHFLYWNTNMDNWLFGPFTYDVFEFFTDLVFKLSKWVMEWMFSTEFVTLDRSFWFYSLDINGVKQFFTSMTIVHDCSGVKQVMQVFIFLIFVPGKIWKRFVYWLCCSGVIIFLNVIRVVGLTGVLVCDQDKFRFVHDWVGRPFMYVFIFLMWVLWIERFARPKTDKKNSQQQSVLPKED